MSQNLTPERLAAYHADIDREIAYQEELNGIIADSLSDDERLSVAKQTAERIAKRAKIPFAEAVKVLSLKVRGTRSELAVRRL